MKNFHLKRILATALVVFIMIFACVNLVIFCYAFWLGFQAQGTPDSQKIAAFVAQYAPLLSVISSMLFTFLAAIWTTRKVDNKIIPHCIFIAACVTVFLIIYGVLFSEAIWHDVLAGAAMLLVSYLGAKSGMMKYKDKPIMENA